MDDVTGNYMGNNPMSKRLTEWSGSLIIRPAGNPVFTPPGVPSGMYGQVPGPLSSPPALSSYVNRLLAQTGPLTPRVNIPLFMYELKDIPMMLRHAGNLLHKIKSPSGLNKAKEAASATLAFQFGWRPLIEDLMKLIDFSEDVKRRQEELEGAHSVKGLRRRVTLETDSWTAEGSTLIWSVYGVSLTQSYVSDRGHKTWGVVTWKVRDPNQIGKKPSYMDAFNAALGGNLGQIPITVWKALPWSWLIDWFAGISTLMQANYNMVYYKPSRLSIMRQSSNNRTYRAFKQGSIEVTSGRIVCTYKQRYVNNSPSVAPNLKVPFLDTFKLSILSSLVVLGITKRRRR